MVRFHTIFLRGSEISGPVLLIIRPKSEILTGKTEIFVSLFETLKTNRIFGLTIKIHYAVRYERAAFSYNPGNWPKTSHFRAFEYKVVQFTIDAPKVHQIEYFQKIKFLRKKLRIYTNNFGN